MATREELEEKYDVMVDEVYGEGKIRSSAPLKHFLVLNWHRDQKTSPAIHQVNLSDRRDLLAAIMKSPGPFYQYADGSFYQDTMGFDEQAYLDQLDSVDIFEVTGGIDFDLLTEQRQDCMSFCTSLVTQSSELETSHHTPPWSSFAVIQSFVAR